LSLSLIGEQISQQAIAHLIADPRYLQFNVLIQVDVRAVFCDWNSTYEDLLLRAQLTSLYNRRLQDIAIFMFKVKQRLLPNNILNIFINTPRNYNLRNSDFLIPRFKSVKFGKHSLRYYGPYLWSKLKSEDRNQTSLSAFKRSIRKTDLSCIA
jgi:hypothetical protein